MNRRHTLTAGIAVAAAAAGAAWSWWRESRHDPAPVPDTTIWGHRFEQPDGGELVLAAFRGKPTVLNFWATWCAPCVEEMPMLDTFYREQAAQGWQVIGLAIDGPTPVREFLTKVPVTFPIGLAGLTGVDLVRELGNPSGGLPFSIIFDRHGEPVFHKLGILSMAELLEWVEKGL